MRTMEEDNFNTNELFTNVIMKNWDFVVDAYRNNPSVRRAKVTRTKHTILHLAVLQKDDRVVEQLVQDMNDDEARVILELKNDSGGTPLHEAAVLGLAKICWLLAQKCKELVVSARNNVGETPLYVAVRHGKKEAFFVLLDCFPESLMRDDLSFCQREDGNTILHAAVHGMFFELAIEIIKLYPRLVNFNDEMGQSPLHVLANKPLVFKNGSSPNTFTFYPRTKVDRLEPKYQPGSMSHRIRMEVEELLCVGDSPTEPRFLNTVINFLKTVIKVLMAPLRIDILQIETTKRKKTMHEHANQVMKELINKSSYWMRNTPDVESSTNNNESLEGKSMQLKDSPILVAAKNGIVEMVENILDIFPVAIEDLDSNHKNIILLSAEHRQLNVYKHMMGRRPRWDNIFAVVDKNGNSALHLAAGTAGYNSSLVLQRPALEMQWEIRWYKFVRYSMEPSFFQLCNNNGQTAEEIFSETHKSLFKDGREWLRNTSQSHSVIATLIATMAFTFTLSFSSSIYQTSGFSSLIGNPALKFSAQRALATLCISFVTIFVFLGLLTGHFQQWDFENYVPVMMLIGRSCLQTSIATLFWSVTARFDFVIAKLFSEYAFFGILLFLSMLELPLYVDIKNSSSSEIGNRFKYETSKTVAITVLHVFLMIFTFIGGIGI